MVNVVNVVNIKISIVSGGSNLRDQALQLGNICICSSRMLNQSRDSVYEARL